MLSWIKKKLFVNKSQKISSEHRKLIDPEALSIVRKLQSAGFESYIVGGCVRDLLLGIPPKDFDIATQASPQQVKSIIGRSFIIGKRFRIVVAKRWPKGSTKKSFSPLAFDLPLSHPKEHEYQITTFRRPPIEVNGLINENVFGSAAEDAERRDFTLNALFLEPSSGKIVDFVGGISDLKAKKLRVIGDPWIRFHEDPIRLLRALRFMMRADLHMTKETEKAFQDSIQHLKEAKKERIREELIKIFKEGRSEKTFKEFQKLNLWKLINPHLFEVFKKNPQWETQLFKFARAIDATPWKHSADSSPLFGLLLLPLLFLTDTKPRKLDSGDWPEDLSNLADELKISKKEREDIAFAFNFLEKIAKDPQGEKNGKIFHSHVRRPELFLRHFYILKICADANFLNFSQVWKGWKDLWVQFHNSQLVPQIHQPLSQRSSSRSAGTRRRSTGRGRRSSGGAPSGT